MVVVGWRYPSDQQDLSFYKIRLGKFSRWVLPFLRTLIFPIQMDGHSGKPWTLVMVSTYLAVHWTDQVSHVGGDSRSGKNELMEVDDLNHC